MDAPCRLSRGDHLESRRLANALVARPTPRRADSANTTRSSGCDAIIIPEGIDVEERPRAGAGRANRIGVFGFSFSELVVVVLVALLAVGPKDLPKVLRRLGQLAAKLQRTAAELRAQSGIDEALRSDGLGGEITEIRKLARGELDVLHKAVTVDGKSSTVDATARPLDNDGGGDALVRACDREYPRDGADAYGAMAQASADDAEPLTRSRYADDPLYAIGDSEPLAPAPTPELEGQGRTLSTIDEPASVLGEADEHRTPTSSAQGIVIGELAEARS